MTAMIAPNAQPLPAPEVRRVDEMPFIDQSCPGEPTFPEGFRICAGLLCGEPDRVDVMEQDAWDRWARIHFNPAHPQSGWIAVPVASSSDDGGPIRTLRKLRNRICSSPEEFIAASRRRCAEAAGVFWERSRVELDEPTLQRLWISSLNILRAIYRPGTVPPGIFAPCTLNDYSYWHGDYHTNYNFQQPFWGVLAANHPELMESYMDACDFLLPIGRKLARELFDAEGAFIQLVGFPSDVKHDPLPCLPLGRMTYMTAWAPQGHWWHYLATGDVDLLRRRGYPFMRECAKFYLSHLEKWDDGYYHCYPSHYSEVGISGSREGHLDATQELCALRFLLRGVIEAGEILGVDEGLRRQWAERLENLPPYPVGKLGDFLTHDMSPRWRDKNLFDPNAMGFRGGGEFLAYPGEEITFDSDERTRQYSSNVAIPEIMQGCYSTGSYQECFLTLPPKMIWYAMLEMRLGRFDSFEGFCEVCRRWIRPNGAYESFPTRVHGHGPAGLQTEGLGIIAPIQEMLLQSWDGILRIFPYWPDGRAARFERLRARGAFLVSAAKSADGAIGPIEIHSERGGACRMLLPWTSAEAECMSAGEPVRVLGLDVDARGVAAWPTNPDETWVVRERNS